MATAPTSIDNRQRVSRNFLALGSGEALSRVIAFAGTLYLARILGADAYGVIALAIGINLYLVKIADFGIDAAGAREIAAARQRTQEMAGAVILLRVILAVILAGLAVFAYQLLLPQPERTVLSLYALTLLPIAAATRWVHIGLESAGAAGAARVVGEMAALALIVLLVSGPGALWVVPVAQITGEVIVTAWLHVSLRRKGGGLRLRWSPDTALPIFRRGLPLLFHVLLGLVIYNSDLVFLRVFRDRADVGYYAAAYALISFAANIGMAYSMSLLPTLSRLRTASLADDERELNTAATAQAYAVTLALAAGGTLLAAQIIQLGFGSEYERSAIALQILVWSVPFSILKLIPWVGLIAHDRGERATGPMAWAVGVNLALNTLLVPPFGIIGAAVATVITEVVCWALMYRESVRSGVPSVDTRRLIKPTGAVVVMAATVVLLPPLNLFTAMAAGVVAFALTLTLLGGIRWRPGLPSFDL